MMCDVMPTISEDGSNDRESQGSGDDSNFEQLMVNMLDERDKLMESLREKQEALDMAEAKLLESNKDREIMQKQLQQTTPQIRVELCQFPHTPGIGITSTVVAVAAVVR
ncbi:liprin-alpha-1 [Elysia marginata]|uniref:Liprin-alpha-1 n=1 Tax=Elysia marginata TaxID=1093978 RepID=A0AAV4JI39_9GAST|nr:liprin-alpha-1 [Elysia marginata]